MKVTTERIPDSQVLMTIEVEHERMDAARGKALRKLAPRAKVPGFRPGKAPPAMVERFLGEERILDEALDVLVPELYREALEADESIHPVARPQFEVATQEPLVLKATIAVRPTVELGDYRSVRVELEPVVVDEKEVEETLLALRRRSATLEPIERELRWRDVVRLDVKGLVDREALVDQQDVEVQLLESRDVLFPGFEEKLLGHRKGEVFEFELTLPDSVQRPGMAGKPCEFTVTIHETKEEVLPELDDEFARGIGEDFTSVEALTNRVRDDLRTAARERDEQRQHDEILGEIVDRSTIEFPPVMADVEVGHMLRDEARSVMRDDNETMVERYLQLVGKTEDQARAELRPLAETRLRRSLVLSKIAEEQAIEVPDADIDAEIAKLAGSGPNAAALRELFEREDGRDTVRRNLLTRRTLSRLVDIATQDRSAAPTAELEAVGAGAASRTPETTQEETVREGD